jgi:hypothetical protein
MERIEQRDPAARLDLAFDTISMPGAMPLSFSSSLAMSAPLLSRTARFTTRSSSASLPRLAMRKVAVHCLPVQRSLQQRLRGTTVTARTAPALPPTPHEQPGRPQPRRRGGKSS